MDISRIWVGGGVCGDCRCKLTAPLMVALIILAVYGINCVLGGGCGCLGRC